MTTKTNCDDNCAEYAFLNITNSLFSFPTAGVLMVNFLNLIIDRKAVNGPYKIYSEDIMTSSYICPEVDFMNLTEITPKAKFYAENTTFQNIMYNVQSIISAKDSRIELYNTNFINISTFYCPDEFAVIMLSSNSSNYISSFMYEKGNVYLNNGYFSKFLSFGSSFLTSHGFNDIKISHVEFGNILILGFWGLSSLNFNSCQSLFCIYHCKQAIITNNTYNYIFTEWSLIYIWTNSDYTNWTVTVRIDNNQFLYLWTYSFLIAAYVPSESSYFIIRDLNISQSLFDSGIIGLGGGYKDTKANIDNIWIINSAFYYMIHSKATKVLNISFIYTKNVYTWMSDFNCNKEIAHYDDIIQLKSERDDYTNSNLETFIDSGNGEISISNIKIDRDSFNHSIGTISWSFANIYDSENLSIKNIDLSGINDYRDGFISVDNCTTNSIINVNLSSISLSTRSSTLSLSNYLNTTILSSYFNRSSITIYKNEHKEDSFLGVYETIFEEITLQFSDDSNKSSHQFINCLFFNTPDIDHQGVFTSEFYGEEHWIITKNCRFQSNQGYLFYFEGANYQDLNSVFEQNNYITYPYERYEQYNSTNNYFFNGSEFYENGFGLRAFEVDLGSLKFSNCNFFRNGGLLVKSSLFIENSSFLNNTVYNFPFIEIEGSESFIWNSYFKNNIGKNTINSSSSSFEIHNSFFLTEKGLGSENLIKIKGSGNFSISNTSIIDNSGQIIINSEGYRNAKIQNSYFKITQPMELGSISFKGGKLFISNITIIGWNDINLYDNFAYSSLIYANNNSIFELNDSNFKGSLYNAVFLNNTNSIRIAKSSFKNGVQSRALEIGDHYECNLTDLKFINNTKSIAGGSILLTNKWEKSHAIIDNCDFYNNQGEIFGGAIVIDGCEIAIKNSRFINNTSLYGGAIVSACYKSNLTNYLINNTFHLSRASAGGAVYWENNYQDVSNNTFIDNYAIYGNITASQHIRLDIINQTYNYIGERVIYKDDWECSLDHDINFQAALIDMDNQTVSYGYYDIAALNCKTNDVTMIGETEKSSELGIFNFSGLKFLCSSGSWILLNLNYTGKINYFFYEGSSNNIPDINFTIETSYCMRGEHHDNNKCEYCKEGTFSLFPYDECEICPTNAYCYGGYQIAPYSGYWHGSNYSSTIYACPNPDACLGGLDWDIGYISLVGVCSEGYRGNMCQPCDFNYSSSGKNKCEKCPSDQDKNAIKIFGILMAAILSLSCVVYFTLKTAYEPKSNISIYCRILINYLQMITFVARLKLNWPFYIEYWLTNQGYPGEVPTHIVSIDCYLMDESDPDSYKSIYFKKMIMITLLPAVLGIAAFIFWSFIAIFQRNWKMMKNELIATLCILLFLILPSITDYMFSIYSCMRIYFDIYLVSNLDIECWSDEHIYYAYNVALPGIIVWTIGTPACVFLFLRKQRFKLHKLDTKLRFGFLYNGYRESTYYWEFVVMIRKLMIICLTVFLTTEKIEIQTASCATIFAVFYYVQNKYYPFEYENLNKIELSSDFVVLTTTWCGLFYANNSVSILANIIFFLFIFSSNIYFVFMWTRAMIIELKLLSTELFPFLKNYFEANKARIKKSSEEKPLFSLINQDEDEEICIKPKNRIKNSVDLSIFKIKENIKVREEQKYQKSYESREELCVSESSTIKSN